MSMIPGYDELKDAGKILKEANKIPEYERILAAQEKLLEMQKRLQDLEEDNSELKKKLTLQESLFTENNAYWLNKDGVKDGPFCTNCWDVNGKTVRLQPSGAGHHTCPNCKFVVKTDAAAYQSHIDQFKNRSDEISF